MADSRKKTEWFINHCIVEILALQNKTYREIVPVQMLAMQDRMNELYKGAVDNFRFIAENLKNGKCSCSEAMEFAEKQLDLIAKVQ